MGEDLGDHGAATEALLAASRTLTGVAARTLGSVADRLSLSQLRVLVLISNRGPMNHRRVAALLGVNASNASRMCDKLVTTGLLERRPREDDRRNVILSLSPQGTELVSSVMEERRRILSEVVARLSPDEQRRLAQSLDAFTRAAAAGSEHADLPTGRLASLLL